MNISLSELHKIQDEYLDPNKLRPISGPMIVKKPGMSHDDYSFLCLAGSIEPGKIMSEHFLIRFNHSCKIKRNYHINEIKSISSSFSEFSITINFDRGHTFSAKLKTEASSRLNTVGMSSMDFDRDQGEVRTFYFQNLADVQNFSYELQKSIIQCNSLCTTKENKREEPATLLGDTLPEKEMTNLNELRDKFKERGDKIKSAVDHSERMRNNAQNFSTNARLLKEQYSNSVWTSNSSSVFPTVSNALKEKVKIVRSMSSHPKNHNNNGNGSENGHNDKNGGS